MMTYAEIRELCHGEMAEFEKKDRKNRIRIINRDFFNDLPNSVVSVLEDIYYMYNSEPWFEEAWEKYRKHVLDAGLGGKIKMPGFVFNEYIDRYCEELEKRNKKLMKHSEEFIDDELEHHGVKGQRWGVRRYQNEDGTLTAEGKARYGVDENGKMSKEGEKLYKQDTKDQKTLDKSNAGNALRAAAKTGGKYIAAGLITSGAALVASKLMLKADNLKGAQVVAVGGKLINGILNTAGGIHMAVSAVKGANEKDKILASQNQND